MKVSRKGSSKITFANMFRFRRPDDASPETHRMNMKTITLKSTHSIELYVLFLYPNRTTQSVCVSRTRPHVFILA